MNLQSIYLFFFVFFLLNSAGIVSFGIFYTTIVHLVRLQFSSHCCGFVCMYIYFEWNMKLLLTLIEPQAHCRCWFGLCLAGEPIQNDILHRCPCPFIYVYAGLAWKAKIFMNVAIQCGCYSSFCCVVLVWIPLIVFIIFLCVNFRHWHQVAYTKKDENATKTTLKYTVWCVPISVKMTFFSSKCTVWWRRRSCNAIPNNHDYR